MSEIKINIKLFGAFREFGEAVMLSVPIGSSAVDVKEALAQTLDQKNHSLVEVSVLANDNAILQESEVFNVDTELSILPPVCGG